MAIKKVKLPNNTVVDVNDARIPGIDNTPTSGSSNVVTSGGVATALGDKYEKPATGIPATDIAAGVIPSAPGTLKTNADTAQAASSGEALSGTITLHKIAKTGSYSDLIGKPTIPDDKVLVAEPYQTTFSEIHTAYGSDGKMVILDDYEYTGFVYQLSDSTYNGSTGSYNFFAIDEANHQILWYHVSESDVWTTSSTVIPSSAPGTLNTTATTAQTTSSNEALSGNVTLHKVSKTGSYADLVGKPTVDSTPTSGSSNLVSSGGVYSALSGKQETLVSGTNIKTVNNTTLLGSGNITVEPGVGFDDVSSQQDGTVVIALTNGDTVTIDLNHVHPQYPEYEHLEDESDMPSSPDPDTLYLIDGGGGGSSNIVHLSSESQMPVSPDADTLYVINESGSGSGYESTSNKVTSLSSSSTDTQYPSAKCVYDLVGDIETLLAAL